MRLLFDENLSRKLVPLLASEFPESAHVVEIGLRSAGDELIWEYARRTGFVLVSKDNDFRAMSILFGIPPKVVMLAIGNAPTSEVAGLLRRHASRIAEFVEAPNRSLLVLTSLRRT